jgi:hypothetical protein
MDLSGRHLEIKPVESLGVTEGLAEGLDRYRRRHVNRD